ncbi:MAG TPA: nucleotidyltransferase domain-containing protein [Chloroflexota bacterium]|nr:nucleotidyltransferase domain-containing protein [Chloroflexota bacterium]
MVKPGAQSNVEATLKHFAECLRSELGAERVLLFGSRARGTAERVRDYDFIVVARSFEGIHILDRGRGLRDIFYEVGGYAPMDLICLTPEEFEEARHRITLVAAVRPEAIDLLAPTAAAKVLRDNGVDVVQLAPVRPTCTRTVGTLAYVLEAQ